MLKAFAAAVALTASLATASVAAETPKTSEECFKTAIDLAEQAGQKKLADDKLAKIEELLTKLEGHCEANQFTEATAVSKDIESAITGN